MPIIVEEILLFRIINTLEDAKELSLQENTLKITLSAYVNLRETAQES